MGLLRSLVPSSVRKSLAGSNAFVGTSTLVKVAAMARAVSSDPESFSLRTALACGLSTMSSMPQVKPYICNQVVNTRENADSSQPAALLPSVSCERKAAAV